MKDKSIILEKKIRGILLSLKLKTKTPREVGMVAHSLFESMRKEDEALYGMLIQEYKQIADELKKTV